MDARLARLRRGLASPEVLFPLKFAAGAFALWVLWASVFRGSLAVLQAATVRLVAATATLTGLQAEVQPGAAVAFAGGAFTYRVTEGCTGWMAGLLYVAAVVAYPARWRQRAHGLALGLPLVLALNLARLVSMAWLGVRWPFLFREAHGVWWQAIIILAVGIGWFAWARHVEDERHGVQAKGRARGILSALGIAVAAVAGLEFAGAATGATAAYGSLLLAAGKAWTAAAGIGTRFPAALSEFEAARFYGGLAGVVALYLATPRVPWRDRAIGSAALGALGQFLFDALVLGWRGVSFAGTRREAEDAYMVGSLLSFAGSTAVWYLWARRSWRPPAAAPGSYACPACGEQTPDPLGHVRALHPENPRKWVRALVRAHPELRAQARGAGAPGPAGDP